MKNIKTTKLGDFRVDFLAMGTAGTQNWLKIFEQLLAGTRNENGVPVEWKLLQETIRNGGKTEIKRVWRVPAASEPTGFVLFKYLQNNRKWNLDRWWRERKISTWRLMRRIERARERGFEFPMRIFLCAERRERGIVREEFYIAEWIDSQGNLEDFPERRGEAIEKILEAHKFGISWGGDPNFGNFLVDRAGTLRGIDFAPERAKWLNRGKDLYRLTKLGLKLPKFFLNAAIVRSREKFIKFLRKLRHRERPVSVTHGENAEKK